MTIPVDAGPTTAGAAPVAPPAWKPPPWRVWLTAVALLAIAVAVIGLAGGLARAPEQVAAGVPVVAVGAEIDGGPWTMSVYAVATDPNIGGKYEVRAGNYQLLVGVRVSVPGPDAEESSQVNRIVTLPDLAGLANPEPRWVVLKRDATQLARISPGLAEDLVYVFEVKTSTPLPDHLTVVLNGWSVHYGWTAQRNEWTNFGPKATVDASVNNGPS